VKPIPILSAPRQALQGLTATAAQSSALRNPTFAPVKGKEQIRLEYLKMLWVKSLHIVFIVSWFAGLFYLPRIFVNLAMETEAAAKQRLLLMARKLYRFMSPISGLAILFGLWLWLGYGIGMGSGNGWLHAKLALVILVIGYHHACGALLKKFESGRNTRSHTWYRWFNEVPVVLLLAIVILVVVKPF
jgi:putative membrane protein